MAGIPSTRYDAGDTITTLADMIPTLIAPEIVASAARIEVFRPLAREFDMTGRPGGALDVVNTPSLAFAALTELTAPNATTFDTGKRTLNPTIRGVDVAISIMAWEEAAVGITDSVAKEAAQGLAGDRDGLFAALYTEAPASAPTHEIGTDGVALSYTTLCAGMALLATQNAPRPIDWCVTPTQWYGELAKDNTLIDASIKGSPVLTQGMGANGSVTQVYDCRIFVSDKVAISSGTVYESMMFSEKAALGYAYRRITSPLTGVPSELLVDVDWDSSARAYNLNMTYYADAEGLKGTSVTTNTWLVSIIS